MRFVADVFARVKDMDGKGKVRDESTGEDEEGSEKNTYPRDAVAYC